jgi:hypothetical protein
MAMKMKRYILWFLIVSSLLTGLEYLNFAALEKDMDIVQTIRGNNTAALEDAATKKKIFSVLFIASALGAAYFLIDTLANKEHH